MGSPQPCLQMWYLLEKHCFHCSLDVLQDRAAVWGKSTMHFIFTVCEAAEENGIYSRIKVKVQEQLRVVEVKARRGQYCRGRSSHRPELAWTDFTLHSPGVQWQNLNPQCRIWLSVWHLFLRRYNFVNCWYFT